MNIPAICAFCDFYRGPANLVGGKRKKLAAISEILVASPYTLTQEANFWVADVPWGAREGVRRKNEKSNYYLSCTPKNLIFWTFLDPKYHRPIFRLEKKVFKKVSIFFCLFWTHNILNYHLNPYLGHFGSVYGSGSPLTLNFLPNNRPFFC